MDMDKIVLRESSQGMPFGDEMMERLQAAEVRIVGYDGRFEASILEGSDPRHAHGGQGCDPYKIVLMPIDGELEFGMVQADSCIHRQACHGAPGCAFVATDYRDKTEDFRRTGWATCAPQMDLVYLPDPTDTTLMVIIAHSREFIE